MRSLRRHHFFIELSAESNLFFTHGWVHRDAVSLQSAQNSLLVNNISRPLIRSQSFCLRFEECLSVWKSSIFTSYQRNDNFVAELKLAIINLKYFGSEIGKSDFSK